MVVKYHGFVTFVLPFCIFPFPHLAYRSKFRTDSLVLWLKRRALFCTRAPSSFGVFKFTFRRSPAQKPLKFRPGFGLDRFAAEIALALEPSTVNYPKRQDIPTKFWLLIGSYKPRTPFSYWRSNRKCFFKVADAAILDFE